MARYCKIDFGANVVAAVELWDSDPGGAYVASDTAGPGWLYDPGTGSLSSPPPPPPPVPETISSRQFFQQLAIEGTVTTDDALAYVSTGALPAAMLAAIGTLEPADQFAVKMAVIGANTFDRHNPMTLRLGAILDKDSAALDALWIAAAALV